MLSIGVSLLVRLWVEIFDQKWNHKESFVSLLVRLWVEIWKRTWGLGLFKSASLWGCELKYPELCKDTAYGCQPPCEAVSWNMQQKRAVEWKISSASLWGCELKFQSNWRTCISSTVSLLVRLWVEMTQLQTESQAYQSQPPCEAVSWNDVTNNFYAIINMSASLWGCELKLRCLLHEKPFAGSASLWGCELKWPDHIRNTHPARQPPCEAVSWNAALLLIVYRP